MNNTQMLGSNRTYYQCLRSSKTNGNMLHISIFKQGEIMQSLREQCDKAKLTIENISEVINQTKVEVLHYEVPFISSLRPQLVKKSAHFHPRIFQSDSTDSESSSANSNLPETDPPKEFIFCALEFLLRSALHTVETRKPKLCNQISFSVGNFSHLRLVLIESQHDGRPRLPAVSSVLEILRSVSAELDQIKARLCNNWTFRREGKVSFLENKDCVGNIAMNFFAAMPMAQSEIFKNSSNLIEFPSTEPLELVKLTWRVKCQLPAAMLLFSHCGIEMPNYDVKFQETLRNEIKALEAINPELSNTLQEILDDKKEGVALYNAVNLFVRNNQAKQAKHLCVLISALHEYKFFMDVSKFTPIAQLEQSQQFTGSGPK